MVRLVRKIFISAYDAKVGRLSVIGFTGIAHHYLQIVSLAPLSGVEPPKEISAAGVAGPKGGSRNTPFKFTHNHFRSHH